MSTFEELVAEIFNDIGAMLSKKHHDYGDHNLDEFGLIGITVRLRDKTARLKSLIMEKKEGEVSDETINDTLMDIAGYAIQGLRMRKEETK